AAVVFCAPLERACNPYFEVDDPRHVNACRYARLAFAVWAAAPQRFVEYHEWLLDGPRVPPLEQARRRAEELIGAAQPIDQLLISPAVQEQLTDALTVYRLRRT